MTRTQLQVPVRPNILLACLAATDAVSGVLAQPSFILYMMLLLLGVGGKSAEDAAQSFHYSSMRAVLVCSSLYYPVFVTRQKLKIAVGSFWFLSVISEVIRHAIVVPLLTNVIAALALICCVGFVSISYVLLYQETRRHQKKMKTEQIPQEDVERFAKENKATVCVQTTVLVVGSVLIGFFPVFIVFLLVFLWSGRAVVGASWFLVLTPFVRTFSMFNSFLNPLIYCLRQREMRKFVLRFPKSIQVVQPADN